MTSILFDAYKFVYNSKLLSITKIFIFLMYFF